MLHSLESQIAFFVLVLVAAFAFIKGGSPERWGMVVIGLGWLGGMGVSLLLHGLFSPQTLELTLLAMDAGMALGLLVLALRFAKIWLGVGMLMQSAELALHGAAMADWGFQFRDYIVFNNIVSFGLIVLLAGATATAWLQRTRKASAAASPIETPRSDLQVGHPAT